MRPEAGFFSSPLGVVSQHQRQVVLFAHAKNLTVVFANVKQRWGCRWRLRGADSPEITEAWGKCGSVVCCLLFQPGRSRVPLLGPMARVAGVAVVPSPATGTALVAGICWPLGPGTAPGCLLLFSHQP